MCCVVTRLQAGRPGFDFRQGRGREFFVSTTTYRSALGLTLPPTQWVPGVKRPGREADHSLPSSAEVRKTWSYILQIPHTFSWSGA